MRSPFAIFRKHQATLMVATVGLAMFGFIVAPAIQDPANMPPILKVIFAAGTFGGVAWILGISRKKSSEFGLIGVIIGTLVGIGISMAGGPPVIVKADTGDLNEREIYNLEQRQALANHFIGQAVLIAREKGGNQILQPPAPFGFHPDPEKDVVIGDLLRHEADQLGIVIPDEVVNDYIRAITQEKVGSEEFNQICTSMGLSQTDLYNILRGEIQARLAAQYLYGGTTLPPEAYWEFYRQLNVRESVGIVPIPVKDFVDDSVEPDEAELQQLFIDHRENYPNQTDDGRLEEGLPGFRQLRKVRLAYLEAAYADVEKTVTPPTDEEIEAFYNERNKPLPAEAFEQDSKPSENNQNGEDAAEDAGTGTTEGPALPAPADESPADQTPDGKIDGDDLPSSEDETASSQEAPSKDASATDASTKAGASEPDASATDQSADDKTEKEEEEEPSEKGAALLRSSATQLVAFFDDEPAPPAEKTEATPTADLNADKSDAADAPVAQKPTAEEPAAEKTVTEEPGSDQSVGDKPDADAAQTPEPPAPPLPQSSGANGDDGTSAEEQSKSDQPPAAPTVRELDDTLRAEIREQLLRQRTEEKLQSVVDDALEMMRDLELRMLNLPDEPGYLTHEQALEELKSYAAQQGLTFTETPLLSPLDLQNSEEYPIGSAVDRLFSDPFNPRPSTTVYQQVFNSEPREVFRNPQSVVQPSTDSRFVYWKIEDQAEYVPESLSDPGIREQVVTEWRELQARDRAQSRAEELAKQAEKAEKPLSEVFTNVTVTGKQDAKAVTVLHPPSFSWMTKADSRMSPNPYMTPPPERTQLRTIPGRVGDSFMKTVFDNLRAGETGVAHSIDKDYYYVVRVDDRSYLRAQDFQAFRKRFMNEQIFAPSYASDYPKLAQQKLQGYQTDWSEALFKKHGVEIVKREKEPAPEEEMDVSDDSID